MPWMEVPQAALLLGVSEKTVKSWIHSGRLTSRTVDSALEVELPDPAAEAIAIPLESDARLALAVHECGRVRGTLVTQERMIEAQAAEIAEVRARAARAEKTVFRRTLACFLLAFGGFTGWLLARSGWQADLDARMAEARQAQESLREQGKRELEVAVQKARRATEKELVSVREDAQKEVAAAKASAKADGAKAAADAATATKERVEALEAAAAKTAGEIEELKAARLRAEAERVEAFARAQKAEDRVAELERKSPAK